MSGKMNNSNADEKPFSTCLPHFKILGKEWCDILAPRNFSPACEINLVSANMKLATEDEFQSNRT